MPSKRIKVLEIMNSDEDRRQHPRVPVSDLRVAVHRRGWRGVLGRPPAIECIDFSLGGLQIETNQPFAVGERVVIDLRFREVCMEEINGMVVRVVDRDGEDRYGVEFCFESRFMRTPRVSDCLRRIESYLRQRQSLADAPGGR